MTAPHAAIPPAMKEPGDSCQQGCHHLVPLAVCEPIVVDMVCVELRSACRVNWFSAYAYNKDGKNAQRVEWDEDVRVKEEECNTQYNFGEADVTRQRPRRARLEPCSDL